MADPPRNLDFANTTDAGVPDGWTLSEVPVVREYAGFAVNTFAPEPEPDMAGWTAVGGTTAAAADPPYDVTAAATLGSAVRFTESGGTGGHGLVSPVQRTLQPGAGYTFGVYARSSDAVYVTPVVQVCADCFLGAIYDFAAGAVTHVGWLGAVTPPDYLVLAAVAAEVSTVAGPNGWVRIAVSFQLASDADVLGLPGASDYGVFVVGDNVGTPEYLGSGQSADFWGFFLYEARLAPTETYASAAWLGAEYLSALESPAFATFPSALPQGTTYEGYDRWAFPYLADLDGYLADAMFAGAGVVETYAVGWGTDNYAETNASVTYATFGGGGTTETYAVGWGTDNYAGAISAPVDATWAGDLALDAERYAPAYPEVAYTALPATDKLSAEAHGLVNGVRVRLANAGYPAGAAFPAPLSPHVSYYVVNATADDFQLSTTAGGAAVDLTTEGTGEQFVVPDPRRYWILET